MYFAINILHFMLATKDVFIRDLQAVPGNMSAIKCALVCNNDMKCLSYFHDQNFMKCYPYFRVLPSWSNEYLERNGINYYVNTVNTDGKWCISQGHEYSDVWSTCHSRSLRKATWEGADADCRHRNGKLFIVDSEEEHMFFSNVVQKELEGGSCFIGGWRNHYNLFFKDPWKWFREREISQSEFRWHTDEPTNSRFKRYNCIQYARRHSTYLWDDVDCDTPNNYYCQYVRT